MCEGQDNSVRGSTMQMSNYKCQISRCFLTIYIHCAEWYSKHNYRVAIFILFSKILKHKISELETIFDITLFAILIVWKYSSTLCFQDILSCSDHSFSGSVACIFSKVRFFVRVPPRSSSLAPLFFLSYILSLSSLILP